MKQNSLTIRASKITALCLGILFTMALCVSAQEAVTSPVTVTVIKAGRLLDPAAGTGTTNQIILIENGKFKEIGPTIAIPAGADEIDLSALTVFAGLVDAHNHLALTY